MGKGDAELVGTIATIAAALMSCDRPAADLAMRGIAYSPLQTRKRPSPSVRLQAETFHRDGYTCGYCKGRTIPSCVLKTFSAIYPLEFPINDHPAYWRVFSTVDHVLAGASGGDWRDPTNLATACWQCQRTKGNVSLDHLGWTLHERSRSEWDGLTRVYPRLWELAGRPNERFHRPWLRAFERLWADEP